MKRAFLAATIALTVLFGGSIPLIMLSGRSPPPATPDPATPDPATAPSPPITVAPTPTAPRQVAPFNGGKLYSSATEIDGRPADERQRQRSTQPVDRVTRKAVHKSLRVASVQSRLARCTNAGGFGGTSVTGRVPGAAPATLLLDLEEGEGELRIVDAQVGAWGAASAATVSCAQAVLRGQVVPIAGPRRPGERMRMPFTLKART